MSNFPISFDDDATLPFVNDNLTEIGGEAINAVRDAVFNIEQYLGLGADGTTSSVAARLGISLNPDGTIKPSALTSLGLVTLPITNDQIAVNAEIPESKLKLDHRTQDLFNYVTDLSNGVNTALGWIAVSGSKLEPHLLGAIYRHTLSQIDVTTNPAQLLKNRFRTFRDNNSGYTVINDMNNELLAHQFADGSPTVPATLITTNDGSTYPATHAHVASGIYLNTSRFSTIPQTATDLQLFADYIDSASIFLLGTRIQNLYSNGISRASRSSSLLQDGYGQSVVPVTRVTTYLLNNGTASAPVDNINTGDDIIEFTPAASQVTSNAFDAQFAAVKIGDIIRVNYGTVEVPFLIKEKKYIQSVGNKKYAVRINGKNLRYTTDGYARIDKPLFNTNKYGALSLAAANNNFNAMPSLIVTNPTGAMALGLGFNPDLFNNSSYNLYLALYPTGNPDDGYVKLPAIDVTGNAGATPGKYTLDSIVEATNNAFRQNGYNYRFVAFQYQGEFGIALADPYNNSSFSIFSGIVDSVGVYDPAATALNFPNNVVGLFASSTFEPIDPLGFGVGGSNIASPPYSATYPSPESSQLPTKLFVPLKRNNYYVNGIEKDKLALEPEQVLDQYGDGYWVATIINRNVIPGAGGRVSTTYRIPYDLDTSSLAVGKTLVVQPLGNNNVINYGRFTIESLCVTCPPNPATDITVYDAVHANGVSPANTLDGYDGYSVAIYFNSDSVTFNGENSSDFTAVGPFKRHFEVYVDQNGKTFTQERGRINISGGPFVVNGATTLYTNSELAKLNIVKISSKLRGYQFGSVNKITLRILNLTSNGLFNGYLCYYDGSNYTKQGPLTFGKLGDVVRFYDETNIDYIDIVFDVNTSVLAVSDVLIDFQLFPTLSLDQEVMLLGTCQVNGVTNKVNQLRDERQFGNTSEKDLTTSALNYIALGEKYLHGNGVLRGFDLEDRNGDPNPNGGQIYLTGGLALVNGKFIAMNDYTVVIPTLRESPNFNINWALCVNDKSEYEAIPLLDYDPVLNTPNNINRIFTVYNPVNASTYNIEATTFSDIINNRKDLALLYVVPATVVLVPLSITLQVTDARRYVNDADTNLSLKLTSGNAQGNFKNITSILNWIKYNNAFNGVAIVKGADASTGVVNQNVIFDFDSNVVIDGLNNALLTFNGLVTFGSNITFKNLTLVFNGGIACEPVLNNVMFDNCDITINTPVAVAPANNVIFNIASSDNLKINNCSLLANYNTSPSATGGAVFRMLNSTNFDVNECNFTVYYNSPAVDGYVPGDIFTINNCPNVSITNSTFDGYYNQFLRNTNSDGTFLQNLVITSSYNPNSGPSPDVYDATTDPLGIADGLPVVTYSVSDYVNTGRGYIYSIIPGTLSNFTIDNCTFNYSPTTSTDDRFSFINFQLSTNNSALKNLKITNCNFNHTLASTILDIRAAIAIINTAAAGTSSQPQPTLFNVNISNNYCNSKQLFAVTSQTSSGNMVYPGLVPQNCFINNNTCGSVGYWTATPNKVDNSTVVNSYSDKESGLNIIGNNCHIIYTANSTGTYFAVTGTSGGVTVNKCAYPSGVVTIQNNKCNFITAAITYEESSYLQILNNYLTSYGTSVLTNYLISNAFIAGYAIYVGSNKHAIVPTSAPPEGNDVSCLIQGNSVCTGYWLQPTTFLPSTYYYNLGYINCQASSIISNNTLKGISTTGSAALKRLVMVSGLSNTITGNKIYRKDASIGSYIAYRNFELPVWDGSETYGLVVDNILDTPYIDNVSLDESVIDFTSFPNAKDWVVERNKNQTGYTTVPLTNGMQFYYDGVADVGFKYYAAPGDSRIMTAFTLNPASSNEARSYVLRLVDIAAAPTEFRIACQEDLTKYLPNNVKVINLKLGFRKFAYTVNIASSIKMVLNKYNEVNSGNAYPSLDNFASASGDDTNVLGTGLFNTAPFDSVNGLNINTSTNTQYLDIDLTAIDTTTGGPGTTDVTKNYKTSQRYPLSVSASIYIERFGAAPFEFLISPIVVKYRW